MKSEQLRFWEKVRIGWPNDCWEWQGGTDGTDGYGRFYLHGSGRKSVGTHRYALLAAHDRINEDRQVLHSCDNPPCCNPRHLRLGTHAENMADRMERSDYNRGTANSQAKLTDDNVREIRVLLAGGVSGTEIAAAYGVGATRISGIKTGKNWRHVK